MLREGDFRETVGRVGCGELDSLVAVGSEDVGVAGGDVESEDSVESSVYSADCSTDSTG